MSSRVLPLFIVLLFVAVPPAFADPLLPDAAQDDAGSGRDAPDEADASFRITPNAAYSGVIGGGDSFDWFAFDVPEGVLVEGVMGHRGGCLTLYDADLSWRGWSCGKGMFERSVRVHADVAGTWFLRANYHGSVSPYRFSVGVGQAAPAPDAEVPYLESVPRRGGNPAPTDASGPFTVVAVVDTGINPYHEFFRAPALTAHPSTFLPGFPADADALDLTFDAPSVDAALSADDAAWRSIRRTVFDADALEFDAHVVTFPGTRVVGAVTLNEYGADPVTGESGPSRPVYDDHGHGTASAALAGGADYALADGNVLIVAVETSSGSFADGVLWAAQQPWIDVISLSAGRVGNAPVTFTPLGNFDADTAVRAAVAAGKALFIASGNGFSSTGLVPDRCSTHSSPYLGPPGVLRVGAADPRSGNPDHWHCVPVDVAARTDVQVPATGTFRDESWASGTSAANPNAAGHYAHVLLEARRAGVAGAPASFVQHYLNATHPNAFVPSTSASPSNVATAPVDQGFGVVDEGSVERALARLVRGDPPAPRPELDAWWAADAAVREALWGAPPPNVFDALEPVLAPEREVAHSDAGSGRDAPEEPVVDVYVQPDVRYEGVIWSSTRQDSQDWYAINVTAGDAVSARVTGVHGCVRLADAAGRVVNARCGVTAEGVDASAVANATGTWFVGYGLANVGVPQSYAFDVTLSLARAE